MLGWPKSKGLVGLDIGSSSIKAAELEKKGHGYELVNMGLEELSHDAVVDGTIQNPFAVSLAIGKLFSDSGIRTKNVAASVSGQSVITKKIAVAAANEEELAEAIPYEAQQQIQLDIHEVKLSYQVLGPPNAQNSYDVVLVAVKREKISNYTKVLKQAGKNPVVFDVDAFALQNAFEMNYEAPDEGALALLNIGASLMNINIVRGGEPLFTRDVSVGGNQYTDALQKEFGLSYEDAERVKLGFEYPSVKPEERAAHLRSVSEILLLEIQKTFDFFRQTTSTENIQKIYVAGGSARVEGLVDLLKEEFNTPVETLNPFRKVVVNPEKFDASYVRDLAPRMTIAIGLALRGFDAQ